MLLPQLERVSLTPLAQADDDREQVAPGRRAVYVGSAIACGTLAVIAAVVLPRDERRRHGSYLAALTSVAVLTATNGVFRVRALITFFLFASFGVHWSGIVLPLSAALWQLSTTAIGLFGIAGLVGALGAARAGRWADRGLGERITGLALLLLVVSWLATGQASTSLILLGVGVVALDFAVQAVHVTSQNMIVATDPESSNRLIGGYMVFYSLGSGLGAVTATTVYDAAGWGAASAAGAAFAAAALVVWGVDRLRHTHRPVVAVTAVQEVGR